MGAADRITSSAVVHTAPDGAISGPAPSSGMQAYRASVLHFTGDPVFEANAHHWHEDGLLIVADGHVVVAGDFTLLQPTLPTGVQWQDHRGKIICPGFIDTHTHYSQTDIIASPAAGLLPWLEKYTFPAEEKFADSDHAAEVARFFLDELLANGTTTAMVYCTVHVASVEALFAESAARNMRMAAGKVLMDRHCPQSLRDTAEQGARDTEKLIRRWHKQGRQLYAITPRFAPTSSEAQLRLAGELANTWPDTLIQSHVAENADEISWAQSLFPAARSYLDVYDRAGLLRKRALYGHCIWLDDADRQRMVETGAAVAMCPTSNLFLGSGLFDVTAADRAGMQLSLATDVGGGTSFSMFRTMDALYKVARLGGSHVSALRLFYFATLGGARAMGLEGVVGNFAPGTEADFLILDARVTPLLARRSAQSQTLEELLFVLALLGDDRSVAATYVAGSLLHARSGAC